MYQWSIQLHHKEERAKQGEKKKERAVFCLFGRGDASARCLRHKQRRKAGGISND